MATTDKALIVGIQSEFFAKGDDIFNCKLLHHHKICIYGHEA